MKEADYKRGFKKNTTQYTSVYELKRDKLGFRILLHTKKVNELFVIFPFYTLYKPYFLTVFLFMVLELPARLRL